MTCNNVLQEPFNNLTNWSTVAGTTPAIVTGRTGTGVDTAPTGANIRYAIPSGSQTDTVTLGFALKFTGGPFVSDIVLLRSDSGATDHVHLRLTNLGALSVLRGTISIGVNSANGVIAAGSWYYVELQVKLHDTTGFATVRVNGTVVASATNIDTKNAGTKTVFDTIDVAFVSGASSCIWDDLYLLTGDTCSFQGDTAIAGTVAGSGTTSITFGATATGGVPSFSGAGRADAVFGASAAGVTTGFASGTALVVFDGIASVGVLFTGAGRSDMAFGASATPISLLATAGISFAATNPSAPVVVPPGQAIARASLRFYPHIPAIEYVPIGFKTPDITGIDPVAGTYYHADFVISPAWAPAPGSLIGVVVTSGSNAGSWPAKIEDSFRGTSDWNPAIDYAFFDVVSAVGRVQIWWAVAGPDPGGGTVTVHGWSSSDPRMFFFELRGQSIRPVGSIGAPPPPYVTPGGNIDLSQYNPVVPHLEQDPANPLNQYGLAGVFSPTVDDVVPFTGTKHAPHPASFVIAGAWCDWGSLSATSGPLPAGIADLGTSLSAPPGWTTDVFLPPQWRTAVAGVVNQAPTIIAHRNGFADPSAQWVGEQIASHYRDPIGVTFSNRAVGPLVVGAVEFRSHVLDVLPPVVTEFGVWVLDANGVWHDRTCDIRSIDIERGRSTYTDSFAAATCSLAFANFEGLYSAWNPESIWAQYGGHYQAGVPIQVWGYTGGVATAMFTGTTDSVVDTWPGTVDALTVVQSTDGLKQLARYNGMPLNDNVGANEFTGQRMHRYATAAGWVGPRAIETGWTRMDGTRLDGVALDKMHEVGECEWGWLFVDETGTLVFRQRDALQTDPRMTEVQWVFTDTDDIAGVCYQEPLELSVDEVSIINIAQIQSSEGDRNPQGYTSAVDAASRGHYGPRTWTRNLPIADGALGVAQVVVMEYGDDDKHIQALTFNALLPGHRGAAVNIRINDRIKIYRHYPGGYLLKQELLVQGVHHTVVPSGNRAADPLQWDVTIRTATAALIIDFAHWDEPSPDADGEDTGWDVKQWGL